MTKIAKIDISYNEMKSLVIDSIIQYSGSFQFANLCVTVANNAVDKKVVEDPLGTNNKNRNFYLQEADEKKIQIIIEDLITEDFLKIGNYEVQSRPYYSFTKKGLHLLQQ